MGQRFRGRIRLLLRLAQPLLVFTQLLPSAILRNQAAFDLKRCRFCLRSGIVVAVPESFMLFQFPLYQGLGIAAGPDQVFFASSIASFRSVTLAWAISSCC